MVRPSKTANRAGHKAKAKTKAAQRNPPQASAKKSASKLAAKPKGPAVSGAQASSSSTYTLGLQLTNNSGYAIQDFWMGHDPNDSKVAATQCFHYKTSDTTKPIANGDTYTMPDITVCDKTDLWQFYWHAAHNNNLNGLKKQWFGAKAKHQNGTVTLVVSPVGQNFVVEQQGKSIGKEKTIPLQSPQTFVDTDRFLPSDPPFSIEAMFQQVRVSAPTGQLNLGVCLSGGGSRAMCAGTGQLQALATLEYNGASLLSQVKAISSVSGGGWVAGPYVYLNNTGVTDQDFLNTYVEPSQLTTTGSAPNSINAIPAGNIGNVCGGEAFSFKGLLSQFLSLIYDHYFHKQQASDLSMTWQTMVGKNVLAPYGLFQPGDGGLPNATYTYSSGVLSNNPAYANNQTMLPFYYYASEDGSTPPRAQRPFHIANMSMQVMNNSTQQSFATLVQATPLYTGMFGTAGNSVTNLSGVPIGNGGLATFAFNSVPTTEQAQSSGLFTVTQARQWALADAIGVSSAFLAAGVLKYLKTASVEEVTETYRRYGPDAIAVLDDALSDDARESLRAMLVGPTGLLALEAAIAILLALIKYEGNETVPKYSYFSPNATTAWPSGDSPIIKPKTLDTEFADGGLLENTGLASLMSFTDIDAALVFVNTATPLAAAKLGVIDANGNSVANTNILVDSQIPPLFGYRPYSKKYGYIPFGSSNSPKNPNFGERCYQTTQIFATGDFPALLQGLWQAATGSTTVSSKPTFTKPAAYLQKGLALQPNALFNIAGGRTVNVCWYYLNSATTWQSQLTGDVPSSLTKHFPHYSTITQTQLSPAEFNLLANLCAWSVMTTLPDYVSALVMPS